MTVHADIAQGEVLTMDPERIKALRKSLGFTQPEFADALGVTHRTITHWESDAPGRAPKGPALILLHMLERHPKRMKEVLDLSEVVRQEQEDDDEKGRRR